MVTLEKTIDKYTGPVFSKVLGAFTRTKPIPASPQKILITRLWTLGESLMILPMVKALRDAFPLATIDVLVTQRSKGVFERVSFIDNILLFGASCIKKAHSYDVVIDTEPYLHISALSSWYLGTYVIGFGNNNRNSLRHSSIPFDDAKHEVLLFMDLLHPLGIKKRPKSLEPLSYTKKELQEAKSLLKGCKKPFIGICSTTAESAAYLRRWPRSHFIQAGKKIIATTKGTLVFVGTKQDVSYVKEMTSELSPNHVCNSVGKTSLGTLVALISLCNAFVSIDTGSMHLASAQGVPTLGLFGPNLPVRFAPLGRKSRSLYHKVHCSPCINVHRGEIGLLTCTNNICMQAISVDEVVKETLSLLKK